VVSSGVVAFANLRQRASGPSSTLRNDQGGPAPTYTLSADATASIGATAAVMAGATTTPGTIPSSTPSPGATATTPPLAPRALHLTRHGGQCTGSQTITNSGAQRMTWQWESVPPSVPPSFLYGVNASPQSSGVPGDLSPGIAPGGADTLNVQMKCSGQSYTV